MGKQPWLHELVSCVAAPAVVLGHRNGRLTPDGVSGLLLTDRRLLSTLVIDLDGKPLTPLGCELVGADRVLFTSAARDLGNDGPDPTVLVTQERSASSSGFRELIMVTNHSSHSLTVPLRVKLGTDFATMHQLKTGKFVPEVPPTSLSNKRCTWESDATGTHVIPLPPPAQVAADGVHAELIWQLQIEPGGNAQVEVHVIGDRPGLFEAPLTNPLDVEFSVESRDPRIETYIDRALADLRALVLADPTSPVDAFVAAGSPWFFTLFGRDSVWCARMLLPLGTDLAFGTLSTLARRQGTKHDSHTGEAPGKIMHEFRPGPLAGVDDKVLPPSYYGTIDATPLWISLLGEAYRWGMAPEKVQSLLPALEAAVHWLLESSGLESGFLRYLDESGRGLANQGWKDSGDSIQHQDGRLAEPPIALCEVQGYAYQALTHATTLLAALGGDVQLATRAQDAAAELAQRFRDDFWVAQGLGHPAVALDGHGQQVKTVTSNIGHLLGTGILSSAEAALVAKALLDGELVTDFGLRTMTPDHVHFNPVGYHTGSIWAHDTAITATGLSSEGYDELSFSLATGLLRASEAFEYRMPELFHGGERDSNHGPLPYPAACRPQAWSCASAITTLLAAIEMDIDVPNRVARFSPAPAFAPWWPLDIRGLQIAGESVDLHIDADGKLTVDSTLDFISVAFSRAGGGRS